VVVRHAIDSEEKQKTMLSICCWPRGQSNAKCHGSCVRAFVPKFCSFFRVLLANFEHKHFGDKLP